MNLDELQAVRSKERRTDSLQHLRAGFYDDVDEYVGELSAERDRAIEAADNPFESEQARRLHDEVESAETTLAAIWEARVGKILRNASLAAHDYPADDEALTPEERDLYVSLVERIAATRNEVVAGVGEGRVPDALAEGAAAPEATAAEVAAVPAGAPEAGATRTTGDDAAGRGAGAAGRGVDAAGTPAGEADAEDAPAAVAGDPAVADPTDRTTVRLTDDVGAILGVDAREYDLAAEDVVTLPEENAEPLLKRDAAEEVESDAVASDAVQSDPAE